jgi:hypothetical protein
MWPDIQTIEAASGKVGGGRKGERPGGYYGSHQDFCQGNLDDVYWAKAAAS